MEYVAVIPAGGEGKRLSPLPFSKELWPLKIGKERLDPASVPKPVSNYLIESIRSAGIKKLFFILKKGKWDIPAYYKDGSAFQMDFIYLIARYPYGTPFTINQSYEFVKNYNVFMGFPDIVYKPEVNIKLLLDKHKKNNADLTLGIYRTDNSEKWDKVEIDKKGKVKRLITRPGLKTLSYAWFIAVWRPSFTEFMNGYILEWLSKNKNAESSFPEISVGHVIEAALSEGFYIDSVKYRGLKVMDIGTPEDLSIAMRDF